ncbi:hypothetical protein PAHAL_4G008800 [Panicum hallii]|uniref:DUF241 domain-containing protein n=1 Tax=Panicum hallii TaxID=206008 RepID=A0A2S3HG53_9POAL|nr:uncharacterized protein LOC112890832 [Panicum hallii]PAN22282.1 hypothetical protein PAHAL_4G008800 [Panicum hallii]
MAPSFGRSISFPLSPARSSRRHVRSVSLPSSRAHPLLAHLQNTTRAVRAWAADPSAPATGLAHLDALHAALAELLLLPEARAALQSGSATADCLLDGFLVLADAHGAFQEAVLELRRHAAEAQAALRRRDQPRLASAVRAQRQAEKDLARLASSVRGAAKFPQLAGTAASVAEVEVSGVLTEAVAAVASASAAVFSAVESVSSAATAAVASSSRKPATLISLVTRTKAAAASSDEDKEMAALDKLEDLDECIAKMEAGSDKVFRSILQTRVALLNIHTQTC